MSVINRRTFLRHGASVTAVCITGKLLPLPALHAEGTNLPRSKVVSVRNARVSQHLVARGKFVEEMLDDLMKQLTGEEDFRDAWRQFVSPTDVVGIKVNCLAARMPTSFELVDAIVQRLKTCGIKGKNIIIWDRDDHFLRRAHYKISKKGDGPLCYGSNTPDDPTGGYTRDTYTLDGKFECHLSRILMEQTTCIINVPILKDHDIAGVTGALKNMAFGSTGDDRGRCAGDPWHVDLCSPFINGFWAIKAVREKTKLNICDALRGIFEGGPIFKNPKWVWDFNGLLASTDPVAIDRVCRDIIEAKRHKEGLPPLAKSPGLYGGERAVKSRPGNYIEEAERRGYGVAHRERIDIVGSIDV